MNALPVSALGQLLEPHARGRSTLPPPLSLSVCQGKRRCTDSPILESPHNYPLITTLDSPSLLSPTLFSTSVRHHLHGSLIALGDCRPIDELIQESLDEIWAAVAVVNVVRVLRLWGGRIV